MTALYEIANEYLAVAQKLSDLDLDEQTIADTLEGMSGALEVKATNVAMFIRNEEATAVAIKDAEEKMAARRKAIENRAERMREYLKEQMARTGITRIESPYFVLAIQNNPPKVIVDSESMIPTQFWTQAPPPPPVIDKKAIAKAIKEGEDCSGCHLEVGTRLVIK